MPLCLGNKDEYYRELNVSYMFTNLERVKYTYIKNYGFYLKHLFLQMRDAGGMSPRKLHLGSANCVLSNLAGSDHNRDLTFAATE